MMCACKKNNIIDNIITKIKNAIILKETKTNEEFNMVIIRIYILFAIDIYHLL